MRCPACGQENRDGATFCGDCGRSLTDLRRCPACGALSPLTRRFCDACGRSLGEDEGAPEASPGFQAEPTSFAAGRYGVIRLLGEGGRKRVYLAHDTVLDRDVAIAVIRTGALDDAALARVRAEVRAMARLGDHPHIVTVHDVGEEGGRPFIVSQYMGGGDVEELLEGTPGHRLPVPEALRIVDQVCQALQHAHDHDIIHRDVKPANVWLMPDGTAKLGDFGVALAVGRSRHTLPGIVVGTIAYMAPEQALGEQPDGRTDLYSVGAMLYELVAGRTPFVTKDLRELVSQHLGTTPEPPSRYNPEIPRAVDDLVLRLLAKRREDRLQSAAAACDAVQLVLRRMVPQVPSPTDTGETGKATAAHPRPSVPAPSGPPGEGPPAPPRWPRRRVVLLLGGAAGTGILGMLVLRPEWGRQLAGCFTEEEEPLVIGVMEFEPQGTAPDLDWMCRNTRDGLSAVLSNLEELRVYAKEMIDFLEEKRELSRIEVARELGITRMVTGRMSMRGDLLVLEVQIVDPIRGLLLTSIPRVFSKDRLTSLQNEVAMAVIETLKIRLTPERKRTLFAHRTEDNTESYNLLYETLGAVVEPPDAEQEPPSPPRSAPDPLSLFGFPRAAHAQGAPGTDEERLAAISPTESGDEERIRALLERYRAALESEDIEAVAGLHVELSESQRAALGQYFETAKDLKIEIVKIDVVVAGNEAIATFTREDRFTDARSGREVRLEVRVSSLLARTDGIWKIQGLKKPS
jgi:TolB-like protein/ketosteroid isomerase-like protein